MSVRLNVFMGGLSTLVFVIIKIVPRFFESSPKKSIFNHRFFCVYVRTRRKTNRSGSCSIDFHGCYRYQALFDRRQEKSRQKFWAAVFVWALVSVILIKNIPNKKGKIKEKTHNREYISFACASACQAVPNKQGDGWRKMYFHKGCGFMFSLRDYKKNSRQKVSERLFLSGRSLPPF
ncbi:MAG: hypothetical protein WCD70_04615 [Alphaproteobacteria bacterium]